MRREFALLTMPLAGLVPLVLLGAAAPAPDRLPKLLDELRRADDAHYGCLEKEVSILGKDSANAVAVGYQRTRALTDATSSRALLAALLEYVLRPGLSSFEPLRTALAAAGPNAAATEDVCRCIYHDGEEARVDQMASLPLPAVGEFWAARVLHEARQFEAALPRYRRALEANASDPRTRLFFGIALIADAHPSEALDVLKSIPQDWAPAPVAYWRARALVELGDSAGARRLLEPIRKGWGDLPTVPDASTDSSPVQPTLLPQCLMGRALAALGEETEARAVLEGDSKCRGELGRLDLRLGRPFEALLGLEQSLGYDEPLVLDALSQLGACEWAQKDLAGWQSVCAGEGGPDGCRRLPDSEQAVASACAGLAHDGGSVGDALIEARLKAPRLVPFDERPLPDDQRWRGKRPDSPRSAKAYPTLGAFSIVALSPEAERMSAVSVSQDVDPRGEVSAGGYWLHLSVDHGRTWRGPFYLGFAQQYPYVVLPRSRVPAFDGERIQIEVERREVDESTITFPPVGLRAKSVRKDLFLSIDAAAVELDSDRDGLTDLLEEKLALDPNASDTDGDGVPDGSDPLPLQATQAEANETAELLTAALPFLFGGAAPIQQTAGSRGEPSSMRPQSKPLTSGRTLFVSGTHAILPPGVGVRVIAFSPRLLNAYQQKFGATFPMAFPDIAFDRDHQRALIRYNFGWQGGSLLAEKKEGRWRITPRGSWIT